MTRSDSSRVWRMMSAMNPERNECTEQLDAFARPLLVTRRDTVASIAAPLIGGFPHQDLLAEHQLPAPKGILWYGPPGCGKSLIAK